MKGETYYTGFENGKMISGGTVDKRVKSWIVDDLERKEDELDNWYNTSVLTLLNKYRTRVADIAFAKVAQ